MNTCPNCKYRFTVIERIKINILNKNFVKCPHCSCTLKENFGFKFTHCIIVIAPWFFSGFFIRWVDKVICNTFVATALVLSFLMILNVLMFILSPFWAIFENVDEIKINK